LAAVCTVRSTGVQLAATSCPGARDVSHALRGPRRKSYGAARETSKPNSYEDSLCQETNAPSERFSTFFSLARGLASSSVVAIAPAPNGRTARPRAGSPCQGRGTLRRTACQGGRGSDASSGVSGGVSGTVVGRP